jgi:hypothetical protein
MSCAGYEKTQDQRSKTQGDVPVEWCRDAIYRVRKLSSTFEECLKCSANDRQVGTPQRSPVLQQTYSRLWAMDYGLEQEVHNAVYDHRAVS